MNTHQWLVMFVACGAFLLSGCAAPPTHEQSGTIIGGVLGGALGSQIGGGSGAQVAAVAGTLLGATVGGTIGRSMDASDRIALAHSLETRRTGVAAEWNNPDTGNQYKVVPTRTYQVDGAPCREYTVDGVVAGKKEKLYGNACRQPDGSWRLEH